VKDQDVDEAHGKSEGVYSKGGVLYAVCWHEYKAGIGCSHSLLGLSKTSNTNVWQRMKGDKIVVRTMERYITNADLRRIPTEGGYLCSDPISTYYIFST